jgi:hypothetical protein
VVGQRSSRRTTKTQPLPQTSVRPSFHPCSRTRAKHFRVAVVAGIVFQLAAIVIFVVLGADFILRLAADRPYPHRTRTRGVAGEEKAPDGIGAVVSRSSGVVRGSVEDVEERKRWMVLLGAVFFSALMIVMRGVYRTIELLQGEFRTFCWKGTSADLFFLGWDGYL